MLVAAIGAGNVAASLLPSAVLLVALGPPAMLVVGGSAVLLAALATVVDRRWSRTARSVGGRG